MVTVNSWFISLLVDELGTFEDETHPLLERQQAAFSACYALLREALSLNQIPKQSYSRKKRAYTLLVDVLLGVGPEVFLLCTLSSNISKLATVEQKNLITDLRKWWKSSEHPPGLTTIAKTLCEANNIYELVRSKRKRSYSRVVGVQGIRLPEEEEGL